MKINFTKSQYRALIDLVYLGDMMTNGIRAEDRIEEYEELRKYIYSFAKEMGYEHLIKQEGKQYYETREYEDSRVAEYIEEYDEEIFWTELASRLAFRDTSNLQNMLNEKMEGDTYLREAWKKENDYLTEFGENGLKNIRVNFDKKDS